MIYVTELVIISALVTVVTDVLALVAFAGTRHVDGREAVLVVIARALTAVHTVKQSALHVTAITIENIQRIVTWHLYNSHQCIAK